MVTTSALVGPLRQITFQDGTKLVYTPPRDTLDPRYRACARHHPACDCREAELSEQIHEGRYADTARQETENALQAIARLHRRTDNLYVGAYCEECRKAWPCPTWKLAAATDWLGKIHDQYPGSR